MKFEIPGRLPGFNEIIWIYGTEKKHELEGQIDLFEEVTP